MIIIKNNNMRRFLKIIIPLFLIPFVVIAGNFFIDEKKHLFVSLTVVFLAFVFFISGIERKNIGTRRLVIISVMTALCVIGRFIPFFQPITALTIITAIYLGGESGFMVGASAAFLSNFYFGQGPWTPFQMLSWGLIGLIAGYLEKMLFKNKVFLIIYGVLSGIVYSLIMDVWSSLWYNGMFDLSYYKASIITALPYTLIYSISNFLFLMFLSEPFGKKLLRIKIKYGI